MMVRDDKKACLHIYAVVTPGDVTVVDIRQVRKTSKKKNGR
jgi:hypothetical protein